MYDDLGPDLDGFDLLEEDEVYDLGDQEDYIKSQSIHDIFRYCLKPTLLEAYGNLLHLFLVCLLFRVATQIVKSHNFYHILSSISGVYVLYVFFQIHCLHTVGVILICYIALKNFSYGRYRGYVIVVALLYYHILSYIFDIHTLVVFFQIHCLHTVGVILICYIALNKVSFFSRYRGYSIAAALLTYLFFAEISLVKPQTWERIRGPQMIAAIKIISFAFDLDHGIAKKLTFLNFLGYSLCPGTCIFGPWVSYSEYMSSIENDQWDLHWINKIILSFIKSVIFFTLSVCILEWIVPDNSSYPWIIYRNAMSFRVSHYFVSYVSETSALFAGYKKNQVTKPMSIEIPHSLVEVVVYWNLPLHKWLKTYVFKTTIQAGSLVAVMSTYFISALLHGLNIRLAAVLLSLGVYTYVEHSFRADLADKFSACISSRTCSVPCQKHKNTTNNLIVHTVNNLFTILAMFHLAYLGVLIDMSNSKKVTLENAFLEWHNVNYISHIVVFITFFLHKVMLIFV